MDTVGNANQACVRKSAGKEGNRTNSLLIKDDVFKTSGMYADKYQGHLALVWSITAMLTRVGFWLDTVDKTKNNEGGRSDS